MCVIRVECRAAVWECAGEIPAMSHGHVAISFSVPQQDRDVHGSEVEAPWAGDATTGPRGPCRHASSKQAIKPSRISGRCRRLRSGSGAQAAIRWPARGPPRRIPRKLSRNSPRSPAGANRARRNIIRIGPLIERNTPGASAGVQITVSAARVGPRFHANTVDPLHGPLRADVLEANKKDDGADGMKSVWDRAGNVQPISTSHRSAS
jgi:hypothetical protein